MQIKAKIKELSESKENEYSLCLIESEWINTVEHTCSLDHNRGSSEVF